MICGAFCRASDISPWGSLCMGIILRMLACKSPSSKWRVSQMAAISKGGRYKSRGEGSLRLDRVVEPYIAQRINFVPVSHPSNRLRAQVGLDCSKTRSCLRDRSCLAVASLTGCLQPCTPLEHVHLGATSGRVDKDMRPAPFIAVH